MSHQIGFIGLGKMGKNMVSHLREKGIDVVAYNRTPLNDPDFPTVPTIEELIKALPAPRVVWLMVPNGAVDEVLGQLSLTEGDIVVDGGNSFYKDTVRRAGMLKTKGIHLVDCGTSGGLSGARNGACLMLGGEEEIVGGLSWLWDALSQKLASQGDALRSWNYFGPAGAGHFVKMVHNGIEYGMEQALGEGMEILSKGPYSLDLNKVAATWQNGSVVRGFLEDTLAAALAKDPKLDSFTGKVGGGETGGWTLAAAREFGVEAPVLEHALAARQKSLTNPTVSSKAISAMRREFGGHEEAK